MGINTGMVITFSYALSSAVAAFAGVLVAPLTLTGATMGASLGLKAFAVSIIGGLTSGVGAIVGGLVGHQAGKQHAKHSLICQDYPRRFHQSRAGCRWVNDDGHGFELCRDRDGVWRPSGRY